MKVLIVGLGSIAQKHIAALRNINDKIEFYALRSKSNLLSELGIINIYSTSEATAIDLDFIIISTPTYVHQKNIEDLIRFKKPLFIEKPLSSSIKIEELLPTIAQNKIPTYIACNLRFLDSLNYIKNTYVNSSFRINEINSYCGSYLPSWRPKQDFKESYSTSIEKGGGVHLDLIHEIDYIYWLFGKPVSVNRFFRNNSFLQIKSVDYANYILGYDFYAASIILNYYRRDAKRTLEIVTDKCTVTVDIIANEVFENGELVFKSNQKISDTYELQLQWFIENVLAKGESNFNDINEAFEVLKISIG